ncbi:MAG: LOG family protein [Anaerolineae bacterium]|nr:LOG family protein [Anaerolineae bacterium]
MNVSVFGGSQPKPDSAAYKDALTLGKLLAKRGDTVMTGGYIGTMEAVSRGAAEAGGHVIGVTCDEIENWRSVKANQWVEEIRHKSTLVERLQVLVEDCDAALALPGGIGTLTEISLTWNLTVVGVLPRRPLILIGDGWQTVFDQVIRSFEEYLPSKQQDWIHFVPNVKSAVEKISL